MANDSWRASVSNREYSSFVLSYHGVGTSTDLSSRRISGTECCRHSLLSPSERGTRGGRERSDTETRGAGVIRENGGCIREPRPERQWCSAKPASERGPWDVSVRTLVTRASVIPFGRLSQLHIPVPGCLWSMEEHPVPSKTGGQRRRRVSPSLLERINPNAAGIDCGSAEHYVAVPRERDPEPVRHFKTFTEDLHRLAEWLVSCGIRTVAMEATGVYWIPSYEILEARGIEVLLVNARHVKNVPGRKSDVTDYEWLQELHSVGLLRGSFRPTAEIAALRSYLRHRETLVQGAASATNRMQKALVQMNLQLHVVISNLAGVTGLRIIRDIVAGQTDPRHLAKHRDSRCNASEKRSQPP